MANVIMYNKYKRKGRRNKEIFEKNSEKRSEK